MYGCLSTVLEAQVIPKEAQHSILCVSTCSGYSVCGGRAERLTTTENLVIPYCKMSTCLTGVKPTAHH